MRNNRIEDNNDENYREIRIIVFCYNYERGREGKYLQISIADILVCDWNIGKVA